MVSFWIRNSNFRKAKILIWFSEGRIPASTSAVTFGFVTIEPVVAPINPEKEDGLVGFCKSGFMDKVMVLLFVQMVLCLMASIGFIIALCINPTMFCDEKHEFSNVVNGTPIFNEPNFVQLV